MLGWNEAVFTELVERMGVKGVQVRTTQENEDGCMLERSNTEQYRTREPPPNRRQLARELTNLYRGRCRSRNCTAWTKICSRSSGRCTCLTIRSSMSRDSKRKDTKRGGRLTASDLPIPTDQYMGSSFSSSGPMKNWTQKWTKKRETRYFLRVK